MKIVALLLALAALWAFAAFVTVRDGLNLLFINNLNDNVGRPTEVLVDALQQERRLSVVALGGGPAEREALADGRESTDQAAVAWHGSVDRASLRFAASNALRERIGTAGTQLEQLPSLRQEIDAGEIDNLAVTGAFSAMVDAGLNIYTAITSLDDQEIARQARNLTSLTRARELMSQQDALLAGALAHGVTSEPEVVRFTQLVGAQRFLYETAAAELPPEDQRLYQQALATPEVVAFRQLEEEVITRAQPSEAPPVSAADWRDTAGSALAAMREFELAAADNTLARATPAAVGVVVRLVLAGGLGLIALVAAVIVSITTARNLVRQLERLRDAARDLATNRLPQVVERLSAGERVDVGTEAPPLRFGDDEIGQVGQAFNRVQETAVKAAVQQAELRRGVRDVFLSLARRTQGLVHKQLGVVDAVERRVTDADEMEELFRIDHLATRMRRNAENLIVLAGASSGRAWRQPVAMIDVVRGALAEVEDYTRVSLLPVEDSALEGRVVGDVVHLLAELIENAASYSPPYAPVSVSGQRVAHGFVVEIEDRGLGMSDEELATVNRKLADPPDFSLADASRLGHYVVAKLAQRHGVKVHLRPSPYGGVAAIVLVPGELLVDGETPGVPAPPALPPGRAGSSGAVEAEAAVVVRQRQEPVAATAPGAVTATAPGAVAATAPAGGNGHAAPARPERAAGGTTEAPVRTPSGLPWRVRQASLPRQLREGTTPESPQPVAGEQPARDPEVVRRMMRAYQRGTQLGRGDAGNAGPSGPAAESGDSQEG